MRSSLFVLFPFPLGVFPWLPLVLDPRVLFGGPIFGLTEAAGFVSDFDEDATAVLVLGGFDGVLAVDWGPTLGFIIEADAEFMNPASVG